MAIPDHNYNHNHNDMNPTPHYEESLDQWLCALCFKAISATRPPVFNPENCSCGVEGGGGTSTQRGQIDGYDNTTASNQLYNNNAAQSYPASSSAQSFSSPEGPEKEEFDIKGLDEGYLPPNQTPNVEYQDMSYQMRRFLIEDIYEAPQDGYWNTGGSKRSWGSEESSRDGGWNSGFGESIGEMGAWIEDAGYGYANGYGGVEMVREREMGRVEYPMVLSGVTEGDGEVRN